MAGYTLPEIRERFSRVIGSVNDPELKKLILDAVMDDIGLILDDARQSEREKIATRLEKLGEGRMDYVHANVETATDIELMGGMQATIYGEATGAKTLARIIRGEIDDKGWLPSWRWER